NQTVLFNRNQFSSVRAKEYFLVKERLIPRSLQLEVSGEKNMKRYICNFSAECGQNLCKLYSANFYDLGQ
ncbi:MAG: hypothetical protein OIF32_04790, partial [Campylobacterales bacterium]|nr:hypothetical protein [Campylobacterales bacterium]